MGFFDKITKPFKAAFDWGADTLSSITGGDLLGLGGSIYGSMQSQESHEAANATNLAIANQNLAFQNKAAQQGIRWRVEDAKIAGINPLVALGANTFNPSPVYGGQTGYDPGDYGLGQLGQNINRALSAKMTDAERKMIADKNYYTRRKWEQDLAIGDLEITRLNRELQNQPSMPTIHPSGIIKNTGQTGVNQVPAEQVLSSAVGVEKAIRPMQKMTVSKDGRIYFPLGKAAEEALENDPFVKYRYMGDRAISQFLRVGTGLMDLIVNNPKHDKYVADKKRIIAREFGLKSSDIGYRWHLDQFFIKKSTMRRLNN